MLTQEKQPTLPVLTCSLCGEASRFRLAGITAQTRYTCPQCCSRIAIERGVRPRPFNPFAPSQDPDVRQFARRHDVLRRVRSRMDELS